MVNPFPNNKMFGWSKLKVIADDNVIEKSEFVLGRVENIVGKGENAGDQYFLLFPQCFPKATFSGSLTHSHTMTPFDLPGKQAF